MFYLVCVCGAVNAGDGLWLCELVIAPVSSECKKSQLIRQILCVECFLGAFEYTWKQKNRKPIL